MPTRPLPPEDLEYVLAHTRDEWEQVRGRRLFLTGGTGFFGIWLLETFAHANQRLSLGASVTVLTRSPDRVAVNVPHLWNHSSINFLKGDIRGFDFPTEDFPFLIHAATDTKSRTEETGVAQSFQNIVSGTQNLLNFSQLCRTEKLLFTSSGAVYGKQPDSLTHIPETYAGSPDPMLPSSYYGEAKRVSEFLCAAHGRENKYQTKIARCFAFVGPHLPLDGPYAIGNFIGDTMAKKPIQIKGDGTAYRSYMYAADLAIWLWKILFSGTPFQPYNVGSPDGLSISELACLVANQLESNQPVHIAMTSKTGDGISRYVPHTGLAEKNLNLHTRIPLANAISKTAAWLSHITH